MAKNADIFIEADINNYNIDVIIEDHDDVDVTALGTVLFDPDIDIEPIIEDYLENPNDLDTLYIGNNQVVSATTYTHIQGVGSDTWNITHNLGRKVIIQCFDNNGQEFKGDIQHIDNNNAKVRFGFVLSGYAECR